MDVALSLCGNDCAHPYKVDIVTILRYSGIEGVRGMRAVVLYDTTLLVRFNLLS
jgi:hypothetical protein